MPVTTTIILVGSSRSPGNTLALSRVFAEQIQATVIDLSMYDIAQFDYEFKNRDDDFLPLMKQVLQFDRIVLATPMYWYAPSARMKTFMDRISDLLKVDKDLGRQLRGKKAGLLGTGCDAVPAHCFEEVFKLTFAYLGMQYQGMLYAGCEQEFIYTEHAATIQAYKDNLHVE